MAITKIILRIAKVHLYTEFDDVFLKKKGQSTSHHLSTADRKDKFHPNL